MAPEQQTIRVRLNYPLDRVKEPVLYRLILDYGLIPNIHRANIDVHTGGFIVLDLTGDAASLDRGVRWMQAQGVSVREVAIEDPEEAMD